MITPFSSFDIALPVDVVRNTIHIFSSGEQPGNVKVISPVPFYRPRKHTYSYTGFVESVFFNILTPFKKLPKLDAAQLVFLKKTLKFKVHLKLVLFNVDLLLFILL